MLQVPNAQCSDGRYIYNQTDYHDLAKWLSHFYFFYFFYFFFFFSFFYLDLLLQGWSVGRYHVTQSQSHKICDISHTKCHVIVIVTTCDKVVI